VISLRLGVYVGTAIPDGWIAGRTGEALRTP
jgi:hypothetical protein